MAVLETPYQTTTTAPSDRELSTVAWFQQRAPVDVKALANALGLRVWEDPKLPAAVAGKLVYDSRLGGTEPYAIVVRASDSYARKRFTVAHEIAHFLLHRNRL